jgi:hypothetical protein
MGVAPEAIVKFLYSSIGSKLLACLYNLVPLKTILLYTIFIGCAFSASDGFYPEHAGFAKAEE